MKNLYSCTNRFKMENEREKEDVIRALVQELIGNKDYVDLVFKEVDLLNKIEKINKKSKVLMSKLESIIIQRYKQEVIGAYQMGLRQSGKR